MAFSDPLAHGTSGNIVGADSIDLTIAGNAIAAGRLAVAILATDNIANTTGEHTSVDDPRGNTWTKAGELSGRSESQATGGGSTGSAWYSLIETELELGDVLTFNLSASRVAKAVGVGSFALDASAVTLDGINMDAGNGTEAVDAVLSGLSSTPRLYIGGLTWEGTNINFVQDSDYTQLFVAAADDAVSGTSNQLARLAYRVATLTGDTYQPTGNSATASDHVTFLLAFREVSSGGSSIAPLSAYYRMMGMR